jgi:hypothetical protein
MESLGTRVPPVLPAMGHGEEELICGSSRHQVLAVWPCSLDT